MGAFFVWRAPILSWPRMMCSQVRKLKFLEPSREMPECLKEKRLVLTSLTQTCNEYLYLNINKCIKLAFLLQKPSSDFWVICLIEACHVSMVHMPLPSTPLVMFLEIEHCSPRTRARFSKNQSAPKLENRRTPQWRTSPCSPRVPIPNLLHLLPSRMVGWNELCNPATYIGVHATV